MKEKDLKQFCIELDSMDMTEILSNFANAQEDTVRIEALVRLAGDFQNGQAFETIKRAMFDKSKTVQIQATEIMAREALKGNEDAMQALAEAYTGVDDCYFNDFMVESVSPIGYKIQEMFRREILEGEKEKINVALNPYPLSPSKRVDVLTILFGKAERRVGREALVEMIIEVERENPGTARELKIYHALEKARKEGLIREGERDKYVRLIFQCVGTKEIPRFPVREKPATSSRRIKS